MTAEPWIRELADVGRQHLSEVGGKNASLGEMLRELTVLGVRVPDGFAVTAAAYRTFIRENDRTCAKSVGRTLAGSTV